MRRSSVSARFVPSAIALAIVCAGCGRKATTQDCEIIIDKNVEIQMKTMNISDPAAIEKRKKEIRTEFEVDLKDCVGKRLTDSMMACIQSAQKTDEIDRCMR